MSTSSNGFRFWANQLRLLLSAATYWLLHTLRQWLCQAKVPLIRLETLCLSLIKIGGRVFELADRRKLRLATSHPSQPLWGFLARRAPPRE